MVLTKGPTLLLVQASRVGVLLLDEQTCELAPYMLRPEQVIEPGDLSVITFACRSVFESGETMYIAPDVGR